jgi:CheY-like chemotaxis protein
MGHPVLLRFESACLPATPNRIPPGCPGTPPQQIELPEPRHSRSGPHPATPFTILIVDDDASLRAALESVFAPLGYRVLTAADGDAAYALLASEPADAVLLDVRLPGMSGLALYLAIVHRWPRLEGRIAFMSGDADAPDVQCCRSGAATRSSASRFRSVRSRTGWPRRSAHQTARPPTAARSRSGEAARWPCSAREAAAADDLDRHGRIGDRQRRRPYSDRLERHGGHPVVPLHALHS